MLYEREIHIYHTCLVLAMRLHSCQDLPSPLGYASREKSGYTVVETSPPPWNMLVGKKAATRLRTCQDLPSHSLRQPAFYFMQLVVPCPM